MKLNSLENLLRNAHRLMERAMLKENLRDQDQHGLKNKDISEVIKLQKWSSVERKHNRWSKRLVEAQWIKNAEEKDVIEAAGVR